MASIPITNAPRFLTMQNFLSYSNMHEGLLKSARFAAVIIPQGGLVAGYASFAQELTYLCEVAELPGRGVQNMDVRYYGPNHKLPFQTNYEDLNLTFLCRTKSFERQFFDDWMTIINPVNTFDFNYRDDYRCEINIYQFGDIGNGSPEAQYWITIHNAYPMFVNPQPVTWGDDNFQRLVVSFTYTHWTRRGLDPEPRYGDVGGYSFSLVEGREVAR